VPILPSSRLNQVRGNTGRGPCCEDDAPCVHVTQWGSSAMLTVLPLMALAAGAFACDPTGSH
jgi:hypothetical protein